MSTQKDFRVRGFVLQTLVFQIQKVSHSSVFQPLENSSSSLSQVSTCFLVFYSFSLSSRTSVDIFRSICCLHLFVCLFVCGGISLLNERRHQTDPRHFMLHAWTDQTLTTYRLHAKRLAIVSAENLGDPWDIIVHRTCAAAIRGGLSK